MLVLLPVILLITFALAILVWYQFRPSISYLWLMGAGAALLTWAIVLAFHWFEPPPVLIEVWNIGVNEPFVLKWSLDRLSWPYAFAMCSLLLAVMLTESARLQEKVTPLLWAGSLAVNGAALLGVMANGPITLILAWTAIDIIEAWVLFSNARDPSKIERIALAFFVRVFGSLAVLWAMAFSVSRGVFLNFENIFPETGIFLLVAVGLRLGVLPLHLPVAEEVEVRRGLGTLIRFASPASSLVLLSHLPAGMQTAVGAEVITSLAVIIGLYGALMWVTSSDAISGRPFWLISLTTLAVGMALGGNPNLTIIPGMTLIFIGGVIFLFTQRRRWMVIIPLAACVSMIGLPYTPAAGSLQFMAASPFTIVDISYMLTYVFLMAGYIRHTRQMSQGPERQERWLVVVYPAGLLTLIAGYWALMAIFPETFFSPGVWWAAAVIALLTFGGVALFDRYGRILVEKSPWTVMVLQRAGQFTSNVLSLDWVYQIGSGLFRVVQLVIQFLATMLEGDGGVLWAMVLLVLLLSFLYRGG
jgi:hypothetical protein